MAGSMSDTFEKKVLDFIFKNTSMGLDATNVWIGLFTDAAGTSHDLAFGNEPAIGTGAYARQAVVRTGAGWNAAAGTTPATSNNTNLITFPVASTTWGTVYQFGIFNSLNGVTAADIIYWGDLTVSKTISSGDTATFAAGAISITQD